MPTRPLSSLLRPFSHFCVGSLPFKDPSEALRFIRERPWIVPFWPELPQRASSELMIARARRVLAQDWEGYREEEASGLFEWVKHSLAGLAGVPLFKGQLVGPLSLMNVNEKRSVKAGELRCAADICIREIEWQAKTLQSLQVPLLFVLDEPALGSWPAMGSKERRALREVYSYLYVAVSERGHYLGAHCCGNFSTDLLALPFDLISFDAVPIAPVALFGPPSPHLWQQALHEGKVIVPGVFSATAPAGAYTQLYEEGMERYRALCAELRAIVPAVGPILYSANCGHAYAEAQWLEMVYGRCLLG